jgi:predicted GNAT family acetyltransferase
MPVLKTENGWAIVDDAAEKRYELRIGDDAVATLDYRTAGRRRILGHTEVAESRRGQGLATQLVQVVLDNLRTSHTPATVYCPLVQRYIKGHPEYDVVLDRHHPGSFRLDNENGAADG